MFPVVLALSAVDWRLDRADAQLTLSVHSTSIPHPNADKLLGLVIKVLDIALACNTSYKSRKLP